MYSRGTLHIQPNNVQLSLTPYRNSSSNAKRKKKQMFRILFSVTQRNCIITHLNLRFWRREKLVLKKNRAGAGLLKYSFTDKLTENNSTSR